MKVGVIDYGVGNLGSVLHAVEELRVSAQLVTAPEQMAEVDKLILPGVGNFADCATLLSAGHWVEALHEEILIGKKPLLGVCLGMQLLATVGSEGSTSSGGETRSAGLGLIPGHVVHLRELGCDLRVPHVGWNSIKAAGNHGTGNHRCLLDGIPDGTDFYFVHSYAFVPDEPRDIVATVDYGIEVTAVVHRGNVWGTQFHPEKSSRAGFRMLRNFIDGPLC
jgi:glutamine amidotransferase